MRMCTLQEQRIERTAILLGKAQIDTLKHAHGMIFGLGGVGSYAAEALGRMGIGKLTLVDGDRFEYSNINRQLNALMSTVGKSKVLVTAQRLRDINPDADINPIEAFYLPDTPVPIADDVDFVVDAIDTVSAKLHIIETCNHRNIPILSCMGMGNRLDPTQIRIGELFDTDTCALCRVMRKELRKRGILKLRCVYSTEEACKCTHEMSTGNGRRAISGSVAFVPSVAGLYMAYDIIRTLCSLNPANK
ncbi:MAG TPA: tRNA threonylcarbamoyladenosine dehydratase [Candidatus Limiplasma sp.]|nr:tRNA threonylcarbamoyladenosine dehydratase [Candidatus Limiplasma sp.]